MEDVVMLGDAYEGRRALVTGHTGFKGSWLSAWLLRMGAEVSGYALDPPTQPNLFEALDLERESRSVTADVRDYPRLLREITAARPDVVFHLAAQPIVRESYLRPRETFDVNLMGTVNVLEAARRCESVAAVVVVTSDKCYRNDGEGRACVEDDALGGLDPYSASKGCAELATAAYAAAFFREGRAVASVRAGNVIGGGDWASDRLVPDCVRALVAGAPVVVRHPDAVRPWQHVLDPLAGYLRLGASLLERGRASAGAWNFGPAPEDEGRTVRWVVERFLAEWGSGSWTAAGDQSEAPAEAALLCLDSAKAREFLRWTPAWDTTEAVRRTATWYREFYDDPAAARQLVYDDLTAYAEAATPCNGELPKELP